jgi:hypothetical protein
MLAFIPTEKGTEEQELWKTYNVKKEDLTYLPEGQCFDGCYRYIHKGSGKHYEYDSFENNWYRY